MVGSGELCLASRHRLGGAWPWGRRGRRSGGSDLLPPPCCVEVFGWCLWSLGRFGRRLVWNAALGLVCCVFKLYRFSASFPYKLANSILLYQ